MRLMDQHDNSQMIKRDNSTHSSPIPTPSPPPPPHNIRPNMTLRVTTMFDDVRIGKVAAYDPGTSLVTLREYFHSSIRFDHWILFDSDMKGTKPGLATALVINLSHCRECVVVQEGNEEVLEPLYPIDINKVNWISSIKRNSLNIDNNFSWKNVNRTMKRKRREKHPSSIWKLVEPVKPCSAILRKRLSIVRFHGNNVAHKSLLSIILEWIKWFVGQTMTF